jgi:hypothetical protein
MSDCYSNTKAMLLYPELTNFSAPYLESRAYLVCTCSMGEILLKMKFKSQVQDFINSSDLCSKILGKDKEKRCKQLKDFFSCQDLIILTLSRKTHPNHKIDNFLSHVIRVSMKAWYIGRKVSCDEQMIGLQWRHQGK